MEHDFYLMSYIFVMTELNFDPMYCIVLLVIAPNIPVRLMTGFVQGRI